MIHDNFDPYVIEDLNRADPASSIWLNPTVNAWIVEAAQCHRQICNMLSVYPAKLITSHV